MEETPLLPYIIYIPTDLLIAWVWDLCTSLTKKYFRSCDCFGAVKHGDSLGFTPIWNRVACGIDPTYISSGGQWLSTTGLVSKFDQDKNNGRACIDSQWVKLTVSKSIKSWPSLPARYASTINTTLLSTRDLCPNPNVKSFRYTWPVLKLLKITDPQVSEVYRTMIWISSPGTTTRFSFPKPTARSGSHP